MSFKKKKLAIVVLSFNTKKLLKNCLKSVFRSVNITPEVGPDSSGVGRLVSHSGSVSIIVVDNGSTDGSAEWLKQTSNIKHQASLKVILNDRNLGFCEGNNIGVRYALAQGYDYIMLLNSDTIIKDCFWEPLVDFLENNEKVGVVTPKIYFAPGYEYHSKRYKKSDQGKVIWSMGGVIDWDNVIGANRGVDEIDQGQYDQPVEVDFASGCCFLARAEVWKRVNFLEEKYFMYYEDDDFSQKAKRAGWKVYYVPQARIWHLNAGSSRVGSSLQDYFIIRNRLLFGLRFAPLRAKFALIRESGRLLLGGRKWQKRGVRDYYLQRFRGGSWK